MPMSEKRKQWFANYRELNRDKIRSKFDHTRIKICLNCKKTFQKEIGRTKDRFYCSKECRETHIPLLKKEKLDSLPKCAIEGCDGKATRKSFGLCENCFYRYRRKGTTDYNKHEKAYIYKTGAGYIKIYEPSHLLSDSKGYVYEHRKNLFNKIGDAPHKCYWCGTLLNNWSDIVIDHVNENKMDNEPSNLLVSCNKCNRARGALIPFIRRMQKESFKLFVQACSELLSDI